MAPQNVFITGCNRGIGLEMVKQFLKMPSPLNHLFATYRNEDKSGELLELAHSSPSLHPIKLEATDFAAYPTMVEKVKAVVGDSGLNLMINNSGVPGPQDLTAITPEIMLESYKVNCVAPLLLARAFLPLVKQAAVAGEGKGMGVDRAAIIQMSTPAASIAANKRAREARLYPYRCSKTALNMSMKNLAMDLAGTGVLVMAMHPGWVRTDYGGVNTISEITTETCVLNMLATLATLTEKDHGGFIGYDNTPTAW